MKQKAKLILQVVSINFALITTSFAAAASGPDIKTWSESLFTWSQYIMVIIATAIFVLAGIIYTTSAGNPSRVSYAKKLIVGAVSALLVLFLGRFFLTNVIGV